MMTKNQVQELKKSVEEDCSTIIDRTTALLSSYKEGNLQEVKRLLCSLNFWVQSINQDILNGIDFKEREVMGYKVRVD